MADGGYQRTCTRCQHTWLVASDIAEERPDLKAATSQVMSMIGGNFADQVALRAHYQQLAAAANGNFLDGVAATSATNAWAVGNYYNGTSQTLILHWNGTRWTR